MIDDIPSSDVQKYLSEKKVELLPYIGDYYINLNNKIKPLDNAKVRKALSPAIGRISIIDTVWKDNRKAATGWVSFGVADANYLVKSRYFTFGSLLSKNIMNLYCFKLSSTIYKEVRN